MARQMSFFKPTPKEFGGALSVQGKRKTARLLDCRKPIHFVLKSKKTVTLYHHRVLLRKLLYLYAKRFGVKVYKESVQKDHFHFCIKITNRRLYRSFIRALTGVISQYLGKGLWSLIPYSRVVTWGRDFLNVLDYLLLNDCEVSKIVPYAMRKSKRERPTQSSLEAVQPFTATAQAH
jgi:REP element-mobilizing transposase RayT